MDVSLKIQSFSLSGDLRTNLGKSRLVKKRLNKARGIESTIDVPLGVAYSASSHTVQDCPLNDLFYTLVQCCNVSLVASHSFNRWVVRSYVGRVEKSPFGSNVHFEGTQANLLVDPGEDTVELLEDKVISQHGEGNDWECYFP